MVLLFPFVLRRIIAWFGDAQDYAGHGRVLFLRFLSRGRKRRNLL